MCKAREMQTASLPPISQELMETTLEIARGAGDVTLRWFQSSTLTVENKSDGTPVTQADLAAERYIREQIEKYFPQSSIYGEEEGHTSGNSELTWYVDPIDGTAGFARGVPLYATLLAVNDQHGPAAGVIHIPATNETVWAGRGLGAFSPSGPVKVSDVSSLSESVVTTSCVSRWPREVFEKVSDSCASVRGWGDGYGFLMVASGRLEVMMDLGAGKPMDFAPYPVIFSEAGGRYSALDGSSSIDTLSGIATNGIVHEEFLSLVN